MQTTKLYATELEAHKNKEKKSQWQNAAKPCCEVLLLSKSKQKGLKRYAASGSETLVGFSRPPRFHIL